MKILIYSRGALLNNAGGIAKVLCAMASHFAKQGHSVLMATNDIDGDLFYPVPSSVKLVKTETRFGGVQKAAAKFVRLFSYSLWKRICREEFVAAKYEALINQFLPDVIVVSAVTDAMELLHRRYYDIPVVVMMHGYPENFMKSLQAKRHRRRLFEEAAAKFSSVQVLQPSFVSVVQKYYSGRIDVIGNAITLPEFCRDNAVCYHTLIYPARFDDNKNQKLLIGAWAAIAVNYPDWKLKLCGGETDEKYAEDCRKLVKICGIDQQVEFCGVCRNIYEEFEKSDICVFPSKCEGFALGLVEAMAHGLPCVGLATSPSVNELIKDGENGYLVVGKEQMADKIAKLIEAQDLRSAMGQETCLTARQFAAEIIWQKWDDLLAEIVGS